MTNFWWQKFPIETATACQNKWTWSTVWLDTAKTSSCFRVERLNLTPENFDNFHNLPEKVDDREQMLKGLWPKNNRCNYCKEIEIAGGYSDRMHYNEIGGYTPKELKTDKTATYVTPKILEIYYNNVCNLACLYCDELRSSKWQAENDLFLKRKKIKSIPSSENELYKKCFSWLEINISELVRLNILGGEPFLQHEFLEDILNLLDKHPNKFLQLNIFSNFNVPPKYFYYYIEKIKKLAEEQKIGRFDLTCSIDCWNEQAEYVRSGLNLKLLEEYFDYIANIKEKWLYFNVNSTITCMSLKTMPELIEKIKKFSVDKHIQHNFEIIWTHDFLTPEIFSYDLWKNDFDKIVELINGNSFESQNLKNRMVGLQKKLQKFCKQDNEKIKKLHLFLDEIDHRRNTNWRLLFPYLIV